MLQLSYQYLTTGKTIALTIGTFVGTVMSLLFNTLSRFVIAFPSMSYLVIENSASTNTEMHVSFQIRVFIFSGYMPGLGLLDCIVTLFLVF